VRSRALVRAFFVSGFMSSCVLASCLSARAANAAEPVPAPLVKTKVEGPGSLTLVLIPADEVPGMRVLLDGELLGRESLNGSLPVPTGEHVLEISAPGYKTARVTTVVEPSAPAPVVRIPSLDELPQGLPKLEPTASTQPPGAQNSSTASAHTSSFWDAPRVLGIAAAGIGVIGVGVGVALGFAAKSTYDQSSPFCQGNQCRQEGFKLRQDGFSQAGVATGVLVAGAVLTVAGLAAVLFFPRADRPRTTQGSNGFLQFKNAAGALTF
jgi:hypothetical protein